MRCDTLLAIILLLGGGFGVTIWRYQHSRSDGAREVEARGDELRARLAVTAFWQEREAMNEYLLDPTAELAGEVSSQRAAFDSGTDGLGTDIPAEAQLVAAARAQNDAFVGAFDAEKAAASGTSTAKQGAIARLNEHEPKVLTPTTPPLRSAALLPMSATQRLAKSAGEYQSPPKTKMTIPPTSTAR